PGPKVPNTMGGIPGVLLVDGTMVFASGSAQENAHAFVARPGAATFTDVGVIETKPSHLLTGGRLGQTRVVFGYIDVVGRFKHSIVDVEKGTVTEGLDTEQFERASSWRSDPDGNLIVLVPTERRLYEPGRVASYAVSIASFVAAMGAAIWLIGKGRVATGAFLVGGVAGTVVTIFGLFVYLATHLAG
ncbi:MAG: hypothetical protein ABI175_05325, partial [Polyangiales bacterium]